MNYIYWRLANKCFDRNHGIINEKSCVNTEILITNADTRSLISNSETNTNNNVIYTNYQPIAYTKHQYNIKYKQKTSKIKLILKTVGYIITALELGDIKFNNISFEEIGKAITCLKLIERMLLDDETGYRFLKDIGLTIEVVTQLGKCTTTNPDVKRLLTLISAGANITIDFLTKGG